MDRAAFCFKRGYLAASSLAKQHSDRVKGRAHTETDKKHPLRHAIEFRHESFCVPEFVQLLRKHKIALVIADTGGLHPFTEDVTADFLYLRLHGPEEIYASGYDEPSLKRWTKRIQSWSKGSQPKDAHRIIKKPPPAVKIRDVYVYFDNDIKVRSPADAQSLSHLLGLKATAK